MGSVTVMLLLATALLASCRTLYYDTMETFGKHKREILVDRVEEARDEQHEAKEQFADALEQFTSLVGAPNTELARRYKDLRGELERCEAQAGDVREQIQSIETVSDDLFQEWERELDQYSSDELRRSSRDTMDRTRQRYEQMLRAMKRPEKKMDEVLVAFRDQVLYLKHNLNAQAIASLQGTIDTLELNTAELIAEMELAIAEADSFIEGMGSET
ncbi:MAG: DUF2959 domain-containing protein [Planctomycetes bacterium]|nr:DUF2959 domain-containing protein [Planctomycetota bacterium]